MKNITPRNEKGKAHGLWERYSANDSIWSKRFYNNGKKIGYSEWYWNDDNKLSCKKYYI